MDSLRKLLKQQDDVVAKQTSELSELNGTIRRMDANALQQRHEYDQVRVHSVPAGLCFSFSSSTPTFARALRWKLYSWWGIGTWLIVSPVFDMGTVPAMCVWSGCYGARHPGHTTHPAQRRAGVAVREGEDHGVDAEEGRGTVPGPPAGLCTSLPCRCGSGDCAVPSLCTVVLERQPPRVCVCCYRRHTLGVRWL